MALFGKENVDVIGELEGINTCTTDTAFCCRRFYDFIFNYRKRLVLHHRPDLALS